MSLPRSQTPYRVDTILIEPTGKTLGTTSVPTFFVRIQVGKEWLSTLPMVPEGVIEVQDAASDLTGKDFMFILSEDTTGNKFHVDAGTKVEGVTVTRKPAAP